MIFAMSDKMGTDILKQTSEIAGAIVSSGTTAAFAAKEARKVMAELLGLKSMSFELTQSRGLVEGIEISFELKDEPKLGPVEAIRPSSRMVTVANGEAR